MRTGQLEAWARLFPLRINTMGSRTMIEKPTKIKWENVESLNDYLRASKEYCTLYIDSKPNKEVFIQMVRLCALEMLECVFVCKE